MSDRSKNTGAGRGLRTALVVLLALIVLVVAALVVYAMRNPSEAPAVGQAEIVQSRPTEPAPTGTTGAMRWVPYTLPCPQKTKPTCSFCTSPAAVRPSAPPPPTRCSGCCWRIFK